MAAPSRKRRAVDERVQNNDDSIHDISDNDLQYDSGSTVGSSDSESEIMVTEINVDFEARPFEVPDLPGVKNLIRQLILDNEIVKDLPDILLAQTSIGCVIKQCENTEDSEDDEGGDVFGVISVINISEKKNVPCIHLLRTMLLSKCKESSDSKTYEFLSKLLEDNTNQVGFVICDRFINIPSKIAHPMYDSLRNDILAENAKNLRYKFSHYLTMSKLYEPVNSMRVSSNDDYVNQEDFEFKTESLISFKYSVKDKTGPALQGEWDASEESELMPFRQVTVLTADKWNGVIDKLKSLFGGV